MNFKSTLLTGLIAAVGFTLAPMPAQAGKLVLAEQPVQGRYIVVLKDEAARLSHETAERRATPTVADVASAISRS
ncbi:MAG: hypothetical protein WCZ02_06695, partial [Lysobacterales bacterium]